MKMGQQESLFFVFAEKKLLTAVRSNDFFSWCLPPFCSRARSVYTYYLVFLAISATTVFWPHNNSSNGGGVVCKEDYGRDGGKMNSHL